MKETSKKKLLGPYICTQCCSSMPWRNTCLVIGAIAGGTLSLLANRSDDDNDTQLVLESIAAGASLGAAVGLQLDNGKCNCDRCGQKMAKAK